MHNKYIVPNDVKNPRALGIKRTSEIMINGQDGIFHIGGGTRNCV